MGFSPGSFLVFLAKHTESFPLGLLGACGSRVSLLRGLFVLPGCLHLVGGWGGVGVISGFAAQKF